MMLLAGFIMLHAVDSAVIWLNGSSVVAMWAPHIADHVKAGTPLRHQKPMTAGSRCRYGRMQAGS